MRRRFGRGRRRGSDGGSRSEPIDARGWFDRLNETGRLQSPLTLESAEDIPDDFAVLARGERDGGDLLVGFSPTSGGHASLAVLGHALRQESLPAGIVAISPRWSGADRRRLGLLGDLPTRFEAIEVPELGESGGIVVAESLEVAVPLATGPPMRASRSVERRTARMERATPRRISSPYIWPKRSLIPLKPSRSM